MRSRIKVEEMPLPNLKLLVRPNPGGLPDHRRFLAEGARAWLGGQGDFSDFVISSEDGVKLDCHLSLLGRTRTRRWLTKRNYFLFVVLVEDFLPKNVPTYLVLN